MSTWFVRGDVRGERDSTGIFVPQVDTYSTTYDFVSVQFIFGEK